MQITIWIGVFPLVITRWLTLGLTIYSVATQMVLYYVRHPNHTEALWFAAVANSLLWWTYIKVILHFTHSLIPISAWAIDSVCICVCVQSFSGHCVSNRHLWSLIHVQL